MGKKGSAQAKVWAKRDSQNGSTEAKDMLKQFILLGCSHCGHASPKLRCSGCKICVYCDEACQKAHWKAGGHRVECSRLPKEIRNDNADKQCRHCRKKNPPLTCSRCAVACYCNAQCQREHWLNGKHNLLCSNGAETVNE